MNEEEVKAVLKCYSLKWDDFYEWIKGQTIESYEDGSNRYFKWDVRRFVRKNFTI